MNELNIDDILATLDSLQNRHTGMLKDMQGNFEKQELFKKEMPESVSYPETQREEQSTLTDAELDDIIKELDLLSQRIEPEKNFNPITAEEINQQHFNQTDFPTFNTQPDDENDTFSIIQNETALPGSLPSFPDISIFDPPKPQKKGRKSPEKSKGRIRKFISAGLFYGLLVCLIGAAFLISQGNKKPILGYTFANVLTWSMQSEIPQGSMVVIKDVDSSAIQIGDDITYMSDAETSVTHRVISIIENYENSGERGFETQGIENDTPDFDVVPAVNVVGKVFFHVPMLGGWLSWLREHLVITLIFTAGFMLLIILIKGALKKDSPERRNQLIMNN